MQRLTQHMGTLSQDIRYAFRNLAKSPMFTVVALVSLALGIGANTAIFSLMNQVLLRSLPVRDPQQLMVVETKGSSWGMVTGDNTLSFPMYKDLRDRNTVFDGMLAYLPADLAVTYKGQTERISGDLVSGNYFEVLGVGAAVGRTLTPDDDRTPGAHPVTVLSYAYWMRRFGGSPAVLNQPININRTAMTVVGIAPPTFSSADPTRAPDVFVPIMMKKQMTPAWDDLFNRRAMWLRTMGRLKPGVSREQAEANLRTIYAAARADEVRDIKDLSANARDRFLHGTVALAAGHRGASQLRQQFSTPLWVLMGIVGLVLLIACANVANLLIARAAARQKEIAIRLAIGASRLRIVRQLIVESVTLSLAGALLALLVSAWTGSLLLEFIPGEGLTRALTTTPDSTVLGFNFGLATVTGLLFGLVPALQATRPSLAPTLKDQANSVSSTGAHVRVRKALVIAQVGLSLLLLIGAGLFARSLYNLKSLNPGFRYDQLLTFRVDASLNGYSKSRAIDLYSRIRDGIAAAPGVHAASLGAIAMMSDDMANLTVSLEGYEPKENEDMNPFANWIGPQYFSTAGIPLIMGREFQPSDTAESPKVAIINETVAKKYFPNESPVGRHVRIGRKPPDYEIVGVVKDVKQTSLRDQPARWVYFPYTQPFLDLQQMVFYVRADGDPDRLATIVRRQVQSADPTLPVFGLKSMRRQVNESIFLDRIVSALSAFFGLLATLLAAIGLYGVMAYTVARRTRELGIRMALGADRQTVIRIVMTEVLVLAGTGILLALPVSYPLSKLVESQLFGIHANDPGTVLIATCLLAGVALLAGYIPAMRATRIDPMVALRYE